VTVTPGTPVTQTATLKVTFQGRTTPSQNVDTLFVIWVKDGFAISEEEGISTDLNGEAQVNLPQNEEDSDLSIWVKGERSLAVLKSVGKVADGDTIEIENPLLGGDASGDNIVSFSDFQIFARNYGKNSSEPSFDRLADLNNDGAITFSDFQIFARNYGEPGAPRPRPQ